MAESLAVTGYVTDDVAKRLTEKGSGHVDVRPERGYEDVVMRVAVDDVTDVRVGSSQEGETLVQLVLRDRARVETVVRMTADVAGLSRFNDPTLARLTASATAKIIVS